MPSSFETLVFEIIGRDAGASAAFERFRRQVDLTSGTVDRSNIVLAGAELALSRIGGPGGRGGAAAGATAGMAALAGQGGMGAAIAAGVALAPVAAAVGVGLGGLGLAAFGTAKNTQVMAQVMRHLRPEIAAFSASLQPQVLGVFSQGVVLAGHVLRDIQPVAKATGIALGSVLGQIDAEFRSGTWQSFFHFMAATAGPDVQMLGALFVTLLHDIPPLVQALQPLATGLISLATDAGKLVGGLEKVHLALPILGAIAGALVAGPLGALAGGALGAALEYTRLHTSVTKVNPALLENAQALRNLTAAGAPFAGFLDKMAAAENTADSAQRSAAASAGAFAARLQAAATAVRNLNTAESSALAFQNTYATALVTAATDARALEKALDASRGKIGLQTAAQVSSFSAANTYIGSLQAIVTAAGASAKGVDRAITAIRNGLPVLDAAKTKNQAYWAEVKTLVDWLHRLETIKAIRESVFVTGSGTFTVRPGTGTGLPGGSAGGPFATGGRVSGGIPGRDSVLIAAMPDEAVLSVAHTRMLAPLLAQIGVPGFAAGGLIPSYAGNVAGLVPWSRGDLNATAGIIERAVARATFAGMQAAAAGGGFGASALVAQAFARSLFPAHGWGMAQWPPLLALWNRESGWNAAARNPFSGAAGIPQDITGNFHGGYQGQVIWGENYIAGRYGTPSSAWAHELAIGWYDDHQGYLPPGVSVAVNRTGKPEPVGHRGGPLVHIENYHSGGPADATMLAQQLSFRIVSAGLGS